jgi:hypothetical protein
MSSFSEPERPEEADDKDDWRARGIRRFRGHEGAPSTSASASLVRGEDGLEGDPTNMGENMLKPNSEFEAPFIPRYQKKQGSHFLIQKTKKYNIHILRNPERTCTATPGKKYTFYYIVRARAHL